LEKNANKVNMLAQQKIEDVYKKIWFSL
jgi:hypothetical protein